MAERSVTRTSQRTARALRAALWVGILILTGVVQFIRDAPVDGTVFLLVALAAAVDLVRPLPGSTRRLRATLPVMIGVTVVAAILLLLAPRHTVAEGAIVIALGLTAAVFSWPDRPVADRGASDAAMRRTVVLWSIVGLAVCGWELISFMFGRISTEQKQAHPAISDLLDPALDVGWGRALFIVGWLMLGLLLLVPRRKS